MATNSYTIHTTHESDGRSIDDAEVERIVRNDRNVLQALLGTGSNTSFASGHDGRGLILAGHVDHEEPGDGTRECRMLQELGLLGEDDPSDSDDGTFHTYPLTELGESIRSAVLSDAIPSAELHKAAGVEDCDALYDGLKTYTYSIFDSNPAASSVDAWPSHDDLEIYAESDAEAVDMVRDEIEVQACGLSASDGYEVGQRLYAQITSSETCCHVAVITHELTESDLT